MDQSATPEQWLTRYEQRLAHAASNAQVAGARLRQVGGTATSPRGEVAVKVGAGGALEDLTLTPAARALEADQLARLILDTTRQAQRSVGAQVADITAAYFGEGPALDMVRQSLPPMTDNRTDDDYFANPPEITQ